MHNCKIMVSIVCNVYNHEEYIREALDSFLMQKTDFEYEVLVHDDASTDLSANIIREYEKKYPNIVKPIFQFQNQYKKCSSIDLTYQIPRAKGKYIAFCEGDDFWNDSHKLQKQFDEMEKHPEIDLCSHAAEILQGNEIVGKIAACGKKAVLDTNTVICGGGGMFATNSLFLRSSIYQKIPEFYKYYGLDYMLQIWGSLRGGVLFLPDIMSTYRRGVAGSWTDRIQHDKYANIEHKRRLVKGLHMIDSYTSGQYHVEIIRKIIIYNISCFLLKHCNQSMIKCLKCFRKCFRI